MDNDADIIYNAESKKLKKMVWFEIPLISPQSRGLLLTTDLEVFKMSVLSCLKTWKN